jgi:hypothetical protein
MRSMLRNSFFIGAYSRNPGKSHAYFLLWPKDEYLPGWLGLGAETTKKLLSMSLFLRNGRFGQSGEGNNE